MYKRLQLEFYVHLMMGAMDARNMYSNLAVNKYLHTFASSWISSTSNFDHGTTNIKFPGNKFRPELF